MFGANTGGYWSGSTWVDGAFNAAAVTLDGGTLRIGGSMTIDDSNRGITLGTNGGTFSTDANNTLTIGSAATSYANVITGAGALTKTGSGTPDAQLRQHIRWWYDCQRWRFASWQQFRS